jgi:hypothetical protein
MSSYSEFLSPFGFSFLIINYQISIKEWDTYSHQNRCLKDTQTK